MEALPPIPTPLAQRWREFRIQVLPFLVFALLVGCVLALWRQAGVSSYLSGVAEGVRSTVTSPQGGVLQSLSVQSYQVVQAGDPIAVIQPRDPRVALDLLQSQLAISRLRLQPTVAEQNAMNFEQIRVDLLRTKSELAMAKVNLERAENDVRRNKPLFEEKLVSEEIFDLSLKTRDVLQAEIGTKTRAIAEIEKRLEALSALGVPRTPASNDVAQAMMAGLEGMRDAAATNWGPIVLRAPITGMISVVYRQQGENVVEGEPLLAINSSWADRIVGYMRQPYVTEPSVGMPIQVTTRERKLRQFSSVVAQVGAQLEIITNSLAFVRMGALVDVGLPIVVDVPHGMNLRPGEVVDLAFRSKPAPAGEAPAKSGTEAPRRDTAAHRARPLFE